MKKILSTFLLALTAMTAVAQHSTVEVSYDWVMYNRNGNAITHNMTLSADNIKSKFCDKTGEYVDSLRSTPSGIKQYADMAAAYLSAGKLASLPQKSIYLYVVKDIVNAETTVYDGIESIEEYKFKYSEPLESQDWQIVSDTTLNVIGYDCIMAKTSWRGRDWTAWFTPEIPIGNGPWKLHGLPGLILKAEDSTGQHRFTATGLRQTSSAINIMPGHYTYEPIPRLEMLRMLRRYDEYPIEAMNAAMDGAFESEHSSPISPLCDFPETDYKK